MWAHFWEKGLRVVSELLITCARKMMTDKKRWSGKSGAELSLAAELFLGSWMEPCNPSHWACGLPWSSYLPQDAWGSVSITLWFNPATHSHTAGTTDLVQEKNKAAFAHEHIFGLDFSQIIGKDIPSAYKCLKNRDYVDSSYLGDPQKNWIYQKLRKCFLEFCCIILHVFTCCILIYTVL